MEKFVKESVGTRTPEEVKDLHIEGAQSARIEGLTKEFVNLSELEILNCGLKTLEDLPSLPSVKTLFLGDNKLKGKEETSRIVSQCPNIENLSLVGNKFEELEEIQPLSSLESLVTLDLFNCPLTQKKDYRDQLWDLLPNLQVLDGCDKDGKEVGDEDEEEEEEEEEDEDESDGEVGLEYLQKELIDSEDGEEEGDFDPDTADSPPDNDHELEEEEEEEEDSDEDDDGPSSKKPKLADKED